MTPALELRGLGKSFPRPRGRGLIEVVRDVDLAIPQGRILGLVGESGSGKTTTGLMALRLVEPTAGRILLEGTDITALPQSALKPHRARIQVVFQDSATALNPMLTIRQSVAEPLGIHARCNAAEARGRADAWLARVGLPGYGDRYPHELSGGQRQRVAIARALILGPSVLIADEPTSALDVSVKAQIVNLLMDLQAELGLAILFISHDLSVVRALCDEVAVMWLGRIVERAPTETLFAQPLHPYTRSLLDAIPVAHPALRHARRFPTREALEAEAPRAAAPGAAGLREVAPGHLVEVLPPRSGAAA